jgi:hypothetical protein
MSKAEDTAPLSRRALLTRVALGLSLSPMALAAEPPLLSEKDSKAREVHYVEDASRAKDAQPGANCSNCSIYSSPAGATAGQCTLFPGKLVKAAGWCSSWSGL